VFDVKYKIYKLVKEVSTLHMYMKSKLKKQVTKLLFRPKINKFIKEKEHILVFKYFRNVTYFYLLKVIIHLF